MCLHIWKYMKLWITLNSLYKSYLIQHTFCEMNVIESRRLEPIKIWPHILLAMIDQITMNGCVLNRRYALFIEHYELYSVNRFHQMAHMDSQNKNCQLNQTWRRSSQIHTHTHLYVCARFSHLSSWIFVFFFRSKSQTTAGN